MKRKLLCAFLLLLALTAGGLCHARSYVDASSRINFYYQHDGGDRNRPGVWDVLLSDRLLALTGHGEIYHDSTTDRFLTGRGCCLFSFAHAYQYLCGYASSNRQKADILYKFLSVKPKWSDTGSSISPPGAYPLYANVLAAQPGVRKYTGALDSFSKLVSFFEGNKGVLIVNAPGHYIIAVGAVKHNGTQYVQVVDSLLSATVRSDRITYGKSMDFTVTYRDANAESYEASVHEYWIPYSQFVSKCKLRYAFTAGTAPAIHDFYAEKSAMILACGTTDRIVIETDSENIAFESLAPDICEVDALGRLIWMDEGTAMVRAFNPEDTRDEIFVTVHCINPEGGQVIRAEPGAKIPDLYEDIPLPRGAYVRYEAVAPEESGLYEWVYEFIDPYGDCVCQTTATLAAVAPEKLLSLPESIRCVEAGAFTDTDFAFVFLPEHIGKIEAGAFGDSVVAVFARCPESAIEDGAFPDEARLFWGEWINASD